ncbi:MAG: ferredoxin-type protein NapF [Rhodobacterales bacterium]|nr:ferredoxin-type protein NapF [Rhodobacterales bacterium]
MSHPISRVDLLRGRTARAPAPSRPPWALAEPAFRITCDGCGDCLPACGQGILSMGGDGLPTVSFARGSCTFCGDCVTVCRPGALSRVDKAGAPRAAWSLKAHIGGSCLSVRGITCRTCGDRCDERAIRFRPVPGGIALPDLDSTACTGCGACLAPCPVGAIDLR